MSDATGSTVHAGAAARPPRVLLLTGDAPRHRAVARELARELTLAGVVTQHKRSPVAAAVAMDEEEHEVLVRHVAERDAVERKLCGDGPFPDAPLLSVAPDALNEQVVLRWALDRAPDLVVSFGSGILREPWLSAFDGRLVNVHLGLSPYYRGTATNFWPLVHGEPECVGATLHLTTAALDGGPVLAQLRPAPAAEDGAHEPGLRSALAAAAALPAVLAAYRARRLTPRPQQGGVGRLFRRADFSATAVQRLRRNLAAGMMPAFAADAARRCAAVPIVEVPS